MNFITLEKLNKIINSNLYKIPNDVDLIVGVPRSGLMVASLLSLYLNLPMTDLDLLLNNKIFKSGNTKNGRKNIKKISDARKILIVEDSSCTGNSLIEVKEKLKNYEYKEKIVLCTVLVTEETKELPDIYFEICEAPRMFEWNYMHHKGLMYACMDIDGVLCVDPTEEENDDGVKYKEFIRNAKLRVRPTFRVNCLVTSRLEKYRADTEYWLEKNEIQYDKLIMLPLENKEQRLASGTHGEFKAKIYKQQKKCQIFIESNEYQAEEISKLTGKPVFCVDNQKFYECNKLNKTKGKIIKKLKKILPYRLKKFLKKVIKFSWDV